MHFRKYKDISTINASMKDLTIVGGGITGLSAAYFAAKSGLKVRVLEGSDSFGGLIKTFEVGNADLECFYHHFFLHDKELNWLIDELGLRSSLVNRKTTMGVYTNGRVFKFSTLFDLLRFRPLNLFSKLRFVLCTIYLGKFSNWRTKEDIAALDWFKKWSGKEVSESIWKPLLKVKFGKYSKVVPLAWMIGRLKQRFESRESGSEKLLYLEGSLQVLLEALLEKLKALDVELITRAKVDDILIDNNKVNGVVANERDFLSDKTLFTIPSNIINQVVLKHHTNFDLDNPNIEYFGAVCVILELSESLSPVYWLNIADENSPFGGIIEHTHFIPPKSYDNRHVVYLSKYFSRDEEIAYQTNSEVEQVMLSYLNTIFPNFKEKNILKTHVFRSNTAATVCDLNFSQKVPKVKSAIKDLFICNMAHVYPDERSVNNSIRIASNACTAMGINTDYVPVGSSLSGKIAFE